MQLLYRQGSNQAYSYYPHFVGKRTIQGVRYQSRATENHNHAFNNWERKKIDRNWRL